MSRINPTAAAPRSGAHSSGADLPARDVHERLMTALTELQRAERNAVMWFAEILQRKLYRQLGYGSIHHYAAEALGFSKGKTSQFIRLSESLRSLPELKRAVATGEVAWTKTREVATVATRDSERRWVALARTSSRRELERRIAESKVAARTAGRVDAAQASLVAARASVRPLDPAARSEKGHVRAMSSSAAFGDGPIAAAVSVQLRFTPEQFARFEALVEVARKQGRHGSREEMVLGGLEEMSKCTGDGPEVGAEAVAVPRPIRRSPYQVVVYRCESCGKGHVPTSRGDRPLDLATLRTIVCDSEILGKGKRLRASVSPGKRREVLERDGHRCRAAGCRHTHSLQIHHLVPLEFGGTDDVPNLMTLCRACHRWVHERRERINAIAQPGASLGHTTANTA